MRNILTAITLSACAVSASSQGYEQLIGLPALNGGDPTNLVSATIVGTDAYAVLSGSGLHRVVKVEDIGGANAVSTVIDTATWNTVVAELPSGIAGVVYSSGSDLMVLDLVTDQVVKYDTGTGTASLLVDTATIGGGVTFGGIDNSDGNLLIYQSTSDSLIKTTGAVNGITTVLTDAELVTVTGDDTPTGVSADSNGVIYFGQATSSAGENITTYDPSDMSNGVYLTEEEIVGVGNDVSFSTTAFDIIDDVLYFRDGGTNDAILSSSLTGAATADLVLGEADLVAGPAISDFVGNFTTFGGEVAWAQTINAGGQVAGIYAVPEPTTAALIGLGGLAMLRRRRTA